MPEPIDPVAWAEALNKAMNQAMKPFLEAVRLVVEIHQDVTKKPRPAKTLDVERQAAFWKQEADKHRMASERPRMASEVPDTRFGSFDERPVTEDPEPRDRSSVEVFLQNTTDELTKRRETIQREIEKLDTHQKRLLSDRDAIDSYLHRGSLG
jgi:hypothetical protein